jgi:hypothetical protein
MLQLTQDQCLTFFISLLACCLISLCDDGLTSPSIGVSMLLGYYPGPTDGLSEGGCVSQGGRIQVIVPCLVPWLSHLQHLRRPNSLCLV